MSKRSKRGLMEVTDAVHCLFMAEDKEYCPTCGEDLRYDNI